MAKITKLEKSILDLRQIEGYTIEETIKKVKISRKTFKEIVSNLSEQGLYDEEEIKKAMKRKKQRDYYQKHKNHKKLPSEEEEYRQKCIDILCTKYFCYNETKQFNPILVSKLNNLYKQSFSYKIIYNSILYSMKNLDYANTKVFSSDYQKISYMTAIIKNNLKIVWKKMQRQEEAYEGFTKKINDEEIIHQLNKNIISKPLPKRDMSKFLD